MSQQLSTATILEHLHGMGLSNIETSRDDEFGCWRIRAQGGPVVHIFDTGKVVFSGVKARTLRKALGLTGERTACCNDAAGVIFVAERGEEPGVRLRKAKAEKA
jgi:hypothetical protein